MSSSNLPLRTPSTVPRRLVIAAILIFPLAAGFVSVVLGKDINWDLRNYHYYNAYALLTGRLDFDMAPAQMQTYLNPLLDLPFFWMTRLLPSRTIGFILGFIHGLNLSLVFLIFLRSIRRSLTWLGFTAGVVLVGVTAAAPGFLSELGNTMNDNLVSLFVLGGLAILLWSSVDSAGVRGTPRIAGAALAGFAIGIGIGLKPTIAVYALGLGIALPALSASPRRAARAVVVFLAAAAAGTLLSTGWWWWELWSRFGNPTMPFYNNIFQSPFVPPVEYRQDLYVPKTLGEALIWPVLFSMDGYRVNPLDFMDIRFAVLYAAGLAWLVVTLWRAAARGPVFAAAVDSAPHARFDRRAASFILAFMLASFLLWMLQTSNYRFVIPLELLVPLTFVVLLDRLAPKPVPFMAVSFVAAVITLAALRPFNWIRLPWSDPYLGVDTSALALPGDAMVVMLGGAPTSYVIPDLPATLRFVRPQSNFMKPGPYLLYSRIRTTILEYAGPIYVLYNVGDPGLDLAATSVELRITIDSASCEPLPVNTNETLHICKAELQDTPPPP